MRNLSHAYWQRRFGGDASVPGRVIQLNGTPVTIVGVAAREFFGVEPGQSPDLFVPLSFKAEQYRRTYGADLQRPKVWWLTSGWTSADWKPGHRDTAVTWYLSQY